MHTQTENIKRSQYSNTSSYTNNNPYNRKINHNVIMKINYFLSYQTKKQKYTKRNLLNLWNWKELTFHILRHTFTTTVTLTNGVPFESVRKMHIHKNLRTTQHYDKDLDRKVSEDMKILKYKFSVNSKIKKHKFPNIRRFHLYIILKSFSH
jgi:integrase